jgi:uncharacterized membrane protein YkvI
MDLTVWFYIFVVISIINVIANFYLKSKFLHSKGDSETLGEILMLSNIIIVIVTLIFYFLLPFLTGINFLQNLIWILVLDLGGVVLATIIYFILSLYDKFESKLADKTLGITIFIVDIILIVGGIILAYLGFAAIIATIFGIIGVILCVIGIAILLYFALSE